jgi:hypothetical protein
MPGAWESFVGELVALVSEGVCMEHYKKSVCEQYFDEPTADKSNDTVDIEFCHCRNIKGDPPAPPVAVETEKHLRHEPRRAIDVVLEIRW